MTEVYNGDGLILYSVVRWVLMVADHIYIVCNIKTVLIYVYNFVNVLVGCVLLLVFVFGTVLLCLVLVCAVTFFLNNMVVVCVRVLSFLFLGVVEG